MPELFKPDLYYGQVFHDRVVVSHSKFHGALTIPQFTLGRPWAHVFKVHGRYLRPAA